GSLDNGGSQAQLRDDCGEADDHQGRTHHAEISRGNQAAEDAKHPQLEQGEDRLSGTHPEQTAQGPAREVLPLLHRGSDPPAGVTTTAYPCRTSCTKALTSLRSVLEGRCDKCIRSTRRQGVFRKGGVGVT